MAAWLTGSVLAFFTISWKMLQQPRLVGNWQWRKYGVELDGDGIGVKVSKEI
jgi:malate synthase